MTDPKTGERIISEHEQLIATATKAFVKFVTDPDKPGYVFVKLGNLTVGELTQEQYDNTKFPEQLFANIAVGFEAMWQMGYEEGMAVGEERGRALGAEKPAEPEPEPAEQCPYCQTEQSHLHAHLRNEGCFDAWDKEGRPWPISQPKTK